MANLYVRSTDGSDADNGTTWALAKATLSGAGAIDAAGDVIYVSQSHAESTAAAQTITLAGTAASPVKVICGNDGAAPPTATAATGTVTTTGANGITITGWCYFYGLSLSAGSGAVNAQLVLGSDTQLQTYESCVLKAPATGGNSNIQFGAVGNTQAMQLVWKNCDVSFGSNSGGIIGNLGSFEWTGGSVLSGSAALTSGFLKPVSTGEWIRYRVVGVDLTNVGVTGFLVGKTSNSRIDVLIADCKLPAFTTGGISTGTLEPGDRIELVNCDSAATNYRMNVVDYLGTISTDTSVYNDAGAINDTGAQRYSWLMASSANTEFPHQVLLSQEMVVWNGTTGSSVTATIEFNHNGAGTGTNGALRDNEIWVEYCYLSSSGTPVGTWASTRCANLNLNSNAADIATSTASWTGDTGAWDPQKFSFSFTPQLKGYLIARVCLAKASTSVYIDPMITLS